MLLAMLPDLALPVSALLTPAIQVRITDSDGKVSVRSGDSLSAAVTASGTVTGAVYSIEVTNGEIKTADWNYIKGNRYGFTALQSFTVTDAVYTVADIPEYTFEGCTNLTAIDIPVVEAIGHHAFFNCGKLTGIDVPNAITVDKSAFSYCSALTAVELPKATTLEDSAFYNCPDLTAVELPELTSAGERAFAYCTSLTGISLPKLTSMGEYMFYNCVALTYVEIPRVTAIGSYAFVNCASLTALKAPGTPPTVGTNAFEGTPGTRRLAFVDANGGNLTGDDLDDARTAYKAAEDGNAGDNLWYGWLIPLTSISLDIGDGNIEAFAGPNSVIAVKQGGALRGELVPNGMITITGTTDTNKIVVDSVYADITLDNVSIDVSSTYDSVNHLYNACAFELKNNANVDLTLSGNNILISGTNTAGLKVADGESITIRGGDTDWLTARTNYVEFGNGGAGIGGGGYGELSSETNCGTINIYGGNITAIGSYNQAAGIGGGRGGYGGIISIYGGNITAAGGGSGIGGSDYAGGGLSNLPSGTINIYGGNITATGGSSGIGGGYNNGNESNPACDAYITIMEEATVKASGRKYSGEAISAMNGALEAGSTARILTANFSEEQSSGAVTEVFDAADGDNPLSSITPAENYLSVAFTVPADTYNLKTAGKLQQYTNGYAPAGINFEIPDTTGIYTFNEVEDAPVLTSVSVSGTAQVGRTLTAAVSPSGAAASYQWKAGSTDITGATGSTYIPAAADIGKAITVTATAAGEWFGTVTSSPTSPVIAAYNNNSGDNDGGNGKTHKSAVPEIIENTESPGLPYYIKDGKKVFIGFSATGEYIVPEGVTVLFDENPKSFADVNGHWAKSSIDFVTEREIFQGIDEHNFGPEISMTRAMFVTAIGRLYESSYGSITGYTTFSDVDESAYYTGYVAWAHENGIIGGIGGNMFAPDAEVTHEQMAEIIFRFAAFLGKAPEGAWMTEVTYPDKADISGWAMDSAAYCQLTGIITGGDGGKFAPKSIATRAEAAEVIERFVKEMLK